MDVHRLAPGGPLRLGGVEIAYERRLAGHSDGDVVLHALADAIFGAAGLPDIGEHFPDADAKYRGLDSREFVAAAVAEAGALGYAVVNVDIVVHAEQPRLSAYKAAMRACVAGLVGVSEDRVSVKAKTNEGVDAVGRGEAIACTCVVLLTQLTHSADGAGR